MDLVALTEGYDINLEADGLSLRVTDYDAGQVTLPWSVLER